MYELIVTRVQLETTDGVTYPVTRVYRFEYNAVGDIDAVVAFANRLSADGSQMENRKKV